MIHFVKKNLEVIFSIVFILYINVAMGKAALGSSIYVSLVKAADIKSLTVAFITVSFVLRIYHYIIKRNIYFELHAFFAISMIYLYLSFTMLQITLGISVTNIITSFFNLNVFYYAMAGALVVAAIKRIFQDIGIDMCIGYCSRGFQKSLYLLQACIIFILLETNMAMNATHSYIEIIPFILNPNAMLLAVTGIFVMTNAILITPIIKNILIKKGR